MLKNLFKTFFIILILFGVLFSEDLFLRKKIEIDDRLRNNIGMNPELYKIWIGTQDQSNDQKEQGESKSKTYIPGLPAAPKQVYTSSDVSENSFFNYVVYIYIDNSYNSESIRNRIRYEIVDVWSGFGYGDRKDENIIIQAMAFQDPNSPTTTLQAPADEEKEQLKKDLNKKIEEKEKLSRDLENALVALEEKYIELLEKKDNLKENKTKMTELEEALKNVEEQLALKKEDEEKEKLKKDLDNKIEEKEELETELQEQRDVTTANEARIEVLEKSIENREKEIQAQIIDVNEEEIIKLNKEIQEKDKVNDTITIFRLNLLEQQAKLNQTFKDSLLHRFGQKLDKYNDPVEGCMNEEALNYELRNNKNDPCACLFEKSSRFFTGEGCKNKNATNFNCKATAECKDCCVFAAAGPIVEETGSSTGWILWLAISLLGLLIILSLVAILTNKKKVIYLKPKNKSNKKGESDASENNAAPVAQPVAQSIPTAAPIDEGVMQSEIRTQRQTAVAMSAGQKEGATQIIKDWLEESKNEEENSEE